MDSLTLQINAQSNHKLSLSLGTNQGKITYMNDGLITSHNCDFMYNQHFIDSYNLGKKTGSWQDVDIFWRAHVVCWAANQVKDLDGDFVECGVYKGGFSRMIINYIDFGNLDKTFYLLDTYEGLVEEQITEEERKAGISTSMYEHYRGAYESVVHTFSEFNNVKIIKGIIPDTLSKVESDRVAYLSIDMNCKEPEIAALNYFWDKLVDNAIVVLDDYGFCNHIEQKMAFDKFAEEKKVEILTLPTGQGLLIKPSGFCFEQNVNSVNVLSQIDTLLDSLNEGIYYVKKNIAESNYEYAFILLEDVIKGILSIDDSMIPFLPEDSKMEWIEIIGCLKEKSNSLNDHSVEDFIDAFYKWYGETKSFIKLNISL